MAPGRPLTPIDPDAGPAAALGAAVRKRRLDDGLTLEGLGLLCGYSAQHLSDLERARASVSRTCIAALDAALAADGALLKLLTPAVLERTFAAHDRAAERAAAGATIRDDVDPTNRRGLLEASAVAALGAAGVAAAPVRARDVDPALPAHWGGNLLRLLGRYDETHGPRDVLDTVRRELQVISEHRAAARGELRVALMRVEARWCDLAAWLAGDSGDERERRAWTDRALRLAQEADYADMIAFARARLSERAGSARRAVAHAEEGLRVPGANAQTRAWCSRRAALGHAVSGDEAPCRRHLAVAYDLLDDDDSPPPPWAGGYRLGHVGTLATEARCYLKMAPAKAIGLYDDALRDWPSAEARDGGIERARLALACAGAGEHDGARAEGRKALGVVKVTGSATAARELRHLGAVLNAA